MASALLCRMPDAHSSPLASTVFAPHPRRRFRVSGRAALHADFVATDPGARRSSEPAAAARRSRRDRQFFLAGQEAFGEVDSVQGTIPDTGLGLGPRFNLTAAAGVGPQPAFGGSSPS
jgi:hypothetical protein